MGVALTRMSHLARRQRLVRAEQMDMAAKRRPQQANREPLPHGCVYTNQLHCLSVSPSPRTHIHTHTHNAQLSPIEDKYLIKNTSAEVDYMYLAQIISPGLHVHCVITAPVSGPPAVITMNAKQQF